MLGTKAMAPIVPVIGTVLILVSFGFEYLSFTGYCYAQHRWLDDNELIDAAIKYEVSHVRAQYELATLSYSSPSNFREQNLECCQLDRSGDHPALDGKWIRLLGMYVATVHLKFHFQRDAPQQFFVETVFVNACGHFLERFGRPTGR